MFQQIKVEWMGEKEKREKKSYKGTVWFSLRRSMQCKSEPSEVHSPKTTGSKSRKHRHLNAITTRSKEGVRSGCSRSISNLKDVVIHGSKRHLQEKGSAIISCSPRSIGSNELLNPITHEVVLRNNSRCELRITSFGGFHEGLPGSFVGTLRPGTPGPVGDGARASSPPTLISNRRGRRTSLVLGDYYNSKDGFGGFCSKGKAADGFGSSSSSSSSVTCHRCGEEFGKWEALEVHHLSHHAVTELTEGDSSRKIVEIICRSSWLKSESRPPGGCSGGGRMIDRVLKVHNTQKTLACFEEYREMVKAKAGKLPKKHPRCLADGNELLRFHGTTVSCPLGTGGSHSLCASQRCRVCHLIRNGFSMEKDPKNGIGVFTTSTSGRAFESIELQRAAGGHHDDDDKHPMPRKALVVCRVIAGRVHRPLENVQEMAGQTGFDSLAGKVGLYSNIEELYLLNPRALLPCFVVICKS
ncbi:unnamed protein product [Cuscuta campestris]|uniref:C2H2-type domain-containing protein n=1 Tax=Cuscuta campestris TaxID=132261 RepID=A0A484KXZ7_9ASTE|nr:unnamed protein product [Cuscuta campestris]